MNIYYLGIPGSYSWIAGKKYFKNVQNMRGLFKIASILGAIKNQSHMGIVPLENSNTGSIIDTFDALRSYNIQIVGEIVLKIHQQLSGKKKGNLASLRKCYSHPQSFFQCDTFLSKMSKIEPVFFSDTATAAKTVADKADPTSCAISSSIASKLYGLTILSRNIEDSRNNFTRFAIVSKKGNTWGEKMSVVFTLSHTPGSLFSALRPFAQRNINLTKIESRPILSKRWEYVFFVDFELTRPKHIILDALADLKSTSKSMYVLGFYKKGNIYET